MQLPVFLLSPFFGLFDLFRLRFKTLAVGCLSGCSIEDRKLNFLFQGIDTDHENANSLSPTVDSVVSLANNFARIFMVGVVIVHEAVKRDKAFDERVRKLDEKTVFRD